MPEHYYNGAVEESIVAVGAAETVVVAVDDKYDGAAGATDTGGDEDGDKLKVGLLQRTLDCIASWLHCAIFCEICLEIIKITQ